LQIDHEPSMEKVVETTGGSLDKVADLPAVGLPEDAFLVKLAAHSAAFMASANRQSVVRWMHEVLWRGSPQLSSYLWLHVPLRKRRRQWRGRRSRYGGLQA
jgi:hypothetical protein